LQTAKSKNSLGFLLIKNFCSFLICFLCVVFLVSAKKQHRKIEYNNLLNYDLLIYTLFFCTDQKNNAKKWHQKQIKIFGRKSAQQNAASSWHRKKNKPPAAVRPKGIEKHNLITICIASWNFIKQIS